MGLKVKNISSSSDPELPVPWRPEIEPLPQRDSPYPKDRPLDFDEVKSALWHARGNITRAAEMLMTEPARIGALLKKDGQLADIRAQAAEMLVDSAEKVMLDALEDADKVRQDSASRFVLEKAGRGRGWTRDGQTGIGLSVTSGAGAAGTVLVKWQVDD